jgi:hypothetical protein
MNLKKIYLKISRRLKKFFIGESDYEELDCPDFILEEGEFLGHDPELSDIKYYWRVIKKRVTERLFSLKE